jgi:hypothetical protein
MDIKKILDESGIVNLFCAKQTVPDLKETFKEQYNVQWNNDMNNMAKLENYCQFKQNIESEPYVKTNILTRRQRAVLAHARAGTLPIEIEKGRWRGIPRPDRHCKQCSTAVIEDLSHFMLTCPKTSHIREPLVTDVRNSVIGLNMNTNPGQIITFLLTDHRVMKKTAIFIIKCLEGRS